MADTAATSAATESPAPQGDGAVHADVRFEPSDVASRGILWFAAGLAALILGTALGMWALMSGLTRSRDAEKKPPDYWTRQGSQAFVPFDRPDSSHAGPERSGLSPRPRLERSTVNRGSEISGTVLEETVQMQVDKEEKHLRSYGWVTSAGERDNRIVHIPIEEAMKRYLASKPASGKGSPVEDFHRAPSRSSSGQAPRKGEK